MTWWRMPTTASPTAGTGAGVQNGYPRFTPFVEGGHYWLLFHSTRPYGAVRKKQLWAMAIDVDAAAGGDPSHPAFHVPGQSLITDNIQGGIRGVIPDANIAPVVIIICR